MRGRRNRRLIMADIILVRSFTEGENKRLVSFIENNFGGPAEVE